MSPAVRHTISIAQVERLLQGARAGGHDTNAILRRAGIPSVLLSSPLARVSEAQCAALIRVLMRVMRDEFWGLCERPVRLGTFSEASRAMVERTTLGDALRAGLRYYHLLLDDFVGRLRVESGVAHVDLVERAPWNNRQGYAQSTFLFWGSSMLSWLAACKVPLLEVRLRNERTAFNAATPWLFESDVLFGQARAGLSFDARLLALPVLQNPQTLKRFLQCAPSGLLVKYRDHASATERTRRLLRRHMTTRMLTQDDVAGMLAMTTQTLRRRLQDEGQGFQNIKDELRRDLSIEYLGQPELTLNEIAERVGFSESSTFHRAFKGWTGVAPGEYRQQCRSTAGTDASPPPALPA